MVCGSWRSVVAVGFVAPLLCVVSAVPAGAVGPHRPGWPQHERWGRNCPGGYVCLFRDQNFTGGGIALRRGQGLNDLRAIDFNDQLSSWINASGERYCWYSENNFMGYRHVMNGHAKRNVYLPYNDMASSVDSC